MKTSNFFSLGQNNNLQVLDPKQSGNTCTFSFPLFLSIEDNYCGRIKGKKSPICPIKLKMVVNSTSSMRRTLL